MIWQSEDQQVDVKEEKQDKKAQITEKNVIFSHFTRLVLLYVNKCFVGFTAKTK